MERLDARCALPPTPLDFTVVATDGSHIDVDRHHGINCYLINVGSVALTYGAHPDAVLESQPAVYSDKADLVITSPDGLREVPVEGNLLGIKRSAEEARVMAEMARRLPPQSMTVGLMDGTLIMWNLEAYPSSSQRLCWTNATSPTSKLSGNSTPIDKYQSPRTSATPGARKW